MSNKPVKRALTMTKERREVPRPRVQQHERRQALQQPCWTCFWLRTRAVALGQV